MVFSKWGSNQSTPFLFYMKITFVLIFLNLSFLCFSQDTTNLVPNWSFEQYSSCPVATYEITQAIPWFSANTMDPNFVHACANPGPFGVPSNAAVFQLAKNGGGYVGIEIYGGSNGIREYVESELIEPLIFGRKYCFEMYYNLGNYQMYSSNSFGVVFTVDSLFQNNITNINLIPNIPNTTSINNDTLGWTLMQGEYIAGGGEKFISIGNFYDNANTNYQLTGFGTNSLAYYFIDAIRLFDCTQPDTTVYTIEIFPNPNNGIFTVNYNLGEKPSGNFRIYDAIGKLINDEDLTQNNGTLNLNLLLSDGVYLWEVKDSDGNLLKGDKIVVVK